MNLAIIAIFSDPTVRANIWQAWLDSQPGDAGGHEEGGFIYEMKEVRLQWFGGPEEAGIRFGCLHISSAGLIIVRF